MSSVGLTPRELDLLQLIIDNLKSQEEETITHYWIQQQLGVEKSRVSDLKCQLINKGYLARDRNRFRLTDKAREHISIQNNSLTIRDSTIRHIELRGNVKGGWTQQDEIEVDLTTSSEVITTIPIPHVPSEAYIFALQVVGRSMEHEGIHEGDYVLVQPFAQNQGPKQGQLIVTKYLAQRDESLLDDNNSMINDVPSDLLEGPTVKYFTENAHEERPYRLSWRKDVDRSHFTIRTKYIAPIGKVVATYRVIENLSY